MSKIKKEIMVYCRCERCGDYFEIRGKRSRYCGSSCRRRALYARQKEELVGVGIKKGV